MIILPFPLTHDGIELLRVEVTIIYIVLTRVKRLDHPPVQSSAEALAARICIKNKGAHQGAPLYTPNNCRKRTFQSGAGSHTFLKPPDDHGTFPYRHLRLATDD